MITQEMFQMFLKISMLKHRKSSLGRQRTGLLFKIHLCILLSFLMDLQDISGLVLFICKKWCFVFFICLSWIITQAKLMKFQCGKNVFPLSMDWGYPHTFQKQQPTLPLAEEENQVCVLVSCAKSFMWDENIVHAFN